MSQHYEVVFSMFLRDDISVETLHELHWQLGLGAKKPDVRELSTEAPVLTPVKRRSLPGEEMVELQRQYRRGERTVEHHGWGLHARLYWHDDQWARTWWQTATWLAANAAEDGYAGFYRVASEDQPSVLIIRDRKPYLSQHGAEPVALAGQR